MNRYSRPREEYVEHFAPVIAAGLCTGAYGNKSPQEIGDKAFAIAEHIAKKLGMLTLEELELQRKNDPSAPPP